MRYTWVCRGISHARQLANVAAHLLNLLLELPDSRLAAVVADQGGDGILSQLDVNILESSSVFGLRSEIATGDGRLLLGNVTGDLEHLHSVE